MLKLIYDSVDLVLFFVIPAEVGIQNLLKLLDSRFHGNDKLLAYKQSHICLSKGINKEVTQDGHLNLVRTGGCS